MSFRFSALGVMPRRTSWLINACKIDILILSQKQQHAPDRTGGVTQTLRWMGLGLGRIKLDCADTVQVRGGAKTAALL